MRRIFRMILFYTLLFTGIYAAGLKLSAVQGLLFWNWVNITAWVLILIGIFAGVIQLLLKIRNVPVKTLLISLFSLGCISLFVLVLPLIGFAYQPEHVVILDGKKYVARVSAFLDTDISFYEYVNPLAYKKTVRIIECYGDGAFDPIADAEKGITRDALSKHYFDENGNPEPDKTGKPDRPAD